jgi:hypothetical protein
MKHCCDRCGKEFKQKCHIDNHKKRMKLCKSIEQQELERLDLESNRRIAEENENKALRSLNGKNEEIIRLNQKVKNLEDEIRKLKEENEKLKSNKPKPKDMTSKEITKSYEEQLQLRRDANKKIVDEAPDDEYPNEQEKLRHLQWLNDLAKAELESDSDSDDTKDSLDYSSEEKPKPKLKRVIKKSVYSDSDSD